MKVRINEDEHGIQLCTDRETVDHSLDLEDGIDVRRVRDACTTWLKTRRMLPEEPKVIQWKIRKMPPEIGEESCVGIIHIGPPKFPIQDGNYFSFLSGHYCLNMWAENLKAFLKENPMEEIEILEIISERRFCLVIDKRIPADWLNKYLCYTGCGSMGGGLRALIDFKAYLRIRESK